MPKIAAPLTDNVVKTARPERNQVGWRDLADGGCRGLTLRISPRGEKAWAIRLTVNGRRTMQTIGAYPAVTLAEARRRAGEYLAAAKDGASPEELDARKKAETMTVAAAHGEYVTAIRATLRPGTIALKEGMFQDHIESVIGKRLVRSIRRPDVVDIVGRVSAKGFTVQANRVFAELMALLRWCEARGYIEGVPTIRKRDLRPHGASKEQPRARTLTDDELRAAWKAADSIGDLTGDFLRLLVLTGQRRDEVRLMTWEEIDLTRGIWTIPARRYKTHIDHVVPLSSQALAIIKARHSKGAAGYVLSGRKEGQPFNGAVSALRRLRKAVKGDGDFTLHDIRRTVRTGLSRLGVDGETAELVIGHIPQGIQRVYDRYNRLSEREGALQKWADMVERLAASESNVVALHSAGSAGQ